MADILTPNFNYVYDGIIARELFFEPTVKAPELRQVFSIKEGVKSKMQFTIPLALNKVLRAVTTCDLPEGGAVDITNVTLQTCEFGARFEQCYKAFKETYLEESLAANLAQAELSTYLIGIAQQVISDALARDVFRLASFGDTDSLNPDWNSCEGLFKKLIDGIPTYQVKFIDDISTLNQADGTRALDYLNNLWTGADIVLKQMDNKLKHILVTGNFYENLIFNYQNGALENGGLTAQYENGILKPRYIGTEIVPVYAWDSQLADTTNPFSSSFNTVAIYTAKENHIVGFDRSSTAQDLGIFYDNITRKVYFDVNMDFGYQFIHSGLSAISYGTV